MLISFTIKNWMSFKEKASFSMVKSRELQYGERTAYLKKYRKHILPVAAIYGGNASGKTNFFKAFSFAKSFVIRGTRPDENILVEPFRLDPVCSTKTSQFIFEILVADKIYEFNFSVTKNMVKKEKLVEISSTTEKELYKREDNKINFHSTIKNNKELLNFLNFAFKGTRDNQLFLTNSVSQKVDTFRPIYDWFSATLELIAPDSRFGPFERFIQEGHPLYEVLNSILPLLDTGIKQISGEEVAIDHISIPDLIKNMLNSNIKEGQTWSLHNKDTTDKFIFFKTQGLLKAKKIITYHNSINNNKIKFDIRNESDGTRRVIDLLPAFLDLASDNTQRVYIIDELDRSLHTLLTRKLIELYLDAYSQKSQSQLLFTTHDLLLMDQNLLRRDEMWVTERNKDGSSNLISFTEYKDIRSDKDIRKSYLQGRLGGIPHILLHNYELSAEKK